jgi:ParB family transcriptional regulator, chromosome partitioning protein
MTRKALGRGLGALLRDVETAGPGLQQIPVGLVDANPFQPRRLLAEDRLRELADSIRSSGVVQPLLVRKDGDRYQLVAGERRWRAACLAGLESVPAVIRDLTDQEALELALTENILREDLAPLEVAKAYQALQEKFGFSHEQIAARLGLDRSTVTNTLRLLKLPQEVQDLIDNETLTSGHARALLACSSSEEQIDLARRIAAARLSVREAERLSGSHRGGRKRSRHADISPTDDPNSREAILEMERALGTRVRITGDQNRGKIEISYYSAQDLDRLFEKLVRE